MAMDTSATALPKASIEYRQVEMTDRPVLGYIVKIHGADFAWSTAVDRLDDLD